MLTNPGPTRWNGYYIMLDKCIELKQALILFFDDEFNVEDPITKQEWDTASKILKVLKPLYDVTNEMSGDKHVSVSKVIPLVDILRQTYPVHEDYDDDRISHQYVIVGSNLESKLFVTKSKLFNASFPTIYI